MACTDEHPGTDSKTGDALHLTKCLHLARPLAACLEEHQDFYEKLDIYAEMDVEDEQDLLSAWTKVIREIQESYKAMTFPKPGPLLEMRPKTNTGMAAFDYYIGRAKIVMAYVEDTDTKELLAAGSADDLWDHDGRGILRLSLPPNCKSVTAYVLYSTEDDKDILYRHEKRIQKTTKISSTGT
jgi:hypothetical protein